jgi:ketosteroid isomerase-like protein
MKSLALVLLTSTAPITTAVVYAQPPSFMADSAAAAERRQVLATDDRRTDALRRGDVAPLREIYADDYSLVTPAGIVQTKSDQINDLMSGVLRYGRIEVTERSVRVYGDVAIVLSRERTDIVRNNQQVGGDIRVTRTYKRAGSQWRVIATHASTVANTR